MYCIAMNYINIARDAILIWDLIKPKTDKDRDRLRTLIATLRYFSFGLSVARDTLLSGFNRLGFNMYANDKSAKVKLAEFAKDLEPAIEHLQAISLRLQLLTEEELVIHGKEFFDELDPREANETALECLVHLKCSAVKARLTLGELHQNELVSYNNA